jgi:hypothetical protein
MLAVVDRADSIRMDQYRRMHPGKENSDDARTIALRMLAFADDVHTESGAHARRLTTWQSWAKDHHIAMDSLPTASEARAELERIVASANTECSATASLPWQSKPRRKR